MFECEIRTLVLHQAVQTHICLLMRTKYFFVISTIVCFTSSVFLWEQNRNVSDGVCDDRNGFKIFILCVSGIGTEDTRRRGVLEAMHMFLRLVLCPITPVPLHPTQCTSPTLANPTLIHDC